MPEEVFTEITGVETAGVIYKIDDVGFLNFGVYVMKSRGLLNLPTLKEPVMIDWPDAHGLTVDLSFPKYNARTIELDCMIKAAGKLDFVNKARAFLQVFQRPELRKLELWISDKPMIYMVYAADEVDIEKGWRKDDMFGTFTLKLIEPSPVKRLLKVVGASASISFTSSNPINIYWGDGNVLKGVFGVAVTKTKVYSVPGTYYILLTGSIEEISTFSYNGLSMVWSKY